MIGARGIDVPETEVVINFGTCLRMSDDYVHRIGLGTGSGS